MRSRLGYEKGLSLLNGPTTIDSDYRGEICVILANLGAEPVTVNRGEGCCPCRSSATSGGCL